MKPSVINSNNNTSAGSGGATRGSGINIPVNREYPSQQNTRGPQGPSSTPQYQPHPQHYAGEDPRFNTAPPHASFRRLNNQQQQQQTEYPPQQPSQQFQDFGFNRDIDMNTFPRSRLGRIHHDPFTRFGSNSPQFGFPQFNSLDRRRPNSVRDDDLDDLVHDSDSDFFNRMPQEFRQYIPEKFGQRRTPSVPSTSTHQQQYPTQSVGEVYYQNMPQSPSKLVCDAAIQTEDPASGGGNRGRDQVDHAVPPRHQNIPEPSSHDQYEQYKSTAYDGRRATPPYTQQSQPQQHQQPHYNQYATQTTPPIQKTYYAPQHHQAPPQSQERPVYAKQQTPPHPQTPRASLVRTIPIYVEGRNETLINNREIPAQNQRAGTTAPTSGPSASTSRPYTSFKQQQQEQEQSPSNRPPPLNTHLQNQYQQPDPEPSPQFLPNEPIPLPEPPAPVMSQKQEQQQQQQQQQQPQHQQQTTNATAAAGAPPPETPHTMDSIQRIQDIQHDVLELMSYVEKFKGLRNDKEYIYIDEMLTRNLLKLDNIDTNGKESIRLARKEAIKCIQASLNVLEAKAEENRKRLEQEKEEKQEQQQQQQQQETMETNAVALNHSTNGNSGIESGQQMSSVSSASGEIMNTTTTTTTSTTTTTTTTSQPSQATITATIIPTTSTTTDTTTTTCTTKDDDDTTKDKYSKNSSEQASIEISQAPIPLPPPEGMKTLSTGNIPNNGDQNLTTVEKNIGNDPSKAADGGKKAIDDDARTKCDGKKESSPAALGAAANTSDK